MNGLAGGTGARLYLVTMAVCMGCKNRRDDRAEGAPGLMHRCKMATCDRAH